MNLQQSQAGNMDNQKAQHQLSDQDYKAYREAFDLFDTDRNGYIDKQELLKVFHNLGEHPSDSEMDLMIENADTLNRDGQIEFAEFVNLMNTYAVMSRSKTDEIETAFRAFDKDRNGVIDKDELRKAMADLGDVLTEKELECMMKAADLDRDGVISLDEFAKMFLALP